MMSIDFDAREKKPVKLKFKGFIFDLDGSIFKGDRPIAGAREVVEALRRQGRKVLFLTNNSASTTQSYVEKLCGMGIDVRQEEILTSAVATATYMRGLERGGVYVVGEGSLKSALSDEGFPILDEESATEAKYVVCGLDRGVTYQKLAAASLALQNGAEFIASNADPRLPTDRGYMPGAGAIIDAIKATTGMRPKVIGKPTRRMMSMALKKIGLGRTEVAVAGDALETDIKAAKNAGIFSILFLTGVTRREDLRHARILPDLTLDSIADLMGMI
jgi:4-nitrophenyl phosphatase